MSIQIVFDGATGTILNIVVGNIKLDKTCFRDILCG